MLENPTETLATEFEDTQVSTAVAIKEPAQSNGFTYLPATFDKACEWSDYISRSGLVPDAFRTPVGAPKDASKGRDVYLACARGAELGMKPLQSLMNIAVVNGRTTLSTDAKKALCMQYGDIQSVYDEKDGIPKWTCTATRKGHSDVVITFSAQDAVVAGLMTCEFVPSPDGKSKVRIWKGRSNAWVHYWKRMLLKRAMSWCCDEAFPDILSGFGTTEDYSDMADTPAATNESILNATTTPSPVPRALRKKKTEQAQAPVDPVEPVVVEAEIVEDETSEVNNANADFLPILDSMPDKDLPLPAHTTAVYKKWAQRFAKCLNVKELDIVAAALTKEVGINPFDSSALRTFYKNQKANLENN